MRSATNLCRKIRAPIGQRELRGFFFSGLRWALATFFDAPADLSGRFTGLALALPLGREGFAAALPVVFVAGLRIGFALVAFGFALLAERACLAAASRVLGLAEMVLVTRFVVDLDG
jgi:hypothetical protein